MNVSGTIVGAFFVSVLSNGIIVIGLGVVYQYIFRAILIFIAVIIARSGLKNKE